MFLDEVFGLWLGKIYSIVLGKVIQWKPLIMNTLGPALFDNNNRLITLSGGYKNLHYLTVLPDTWSHLHRTLTH